MKQIGAIFTDIDGCLVSTDGNISPNYYWGLSQISRYIREANQGNFPVIGFCTGRDRNYVEAVGFAVGLPNSWSVIENGIAIFNPTTKELLFNSALTPEVKETFQRISEEEIPEILVRHPELMLYPGNLINITLERRWGKDDIPIEKCYQMVRRELKKWVERGLIITHSHIAVDISPSGIDKASGLKFLSQHAEVNLTRTLGIGDSRGDFPMFDVVGQVGCPANASRECKRYVRKREGYVSPFSFAKGVADIIDHFVRRE